MSQSACPQSSTGWSAARGTAHARRADEEALDVPGVGVEGGDDVVIQLLEECELRPPVPQAPRPPRPAPHQRAGTKDAPADDPLRVRSEDVLARAPTEEDGVERPEQPRWGRRRLGVPPWSECREAMTPVAEAGHAGDAAARVSKRQARPPGEVLGRRRSVPGEVPAGQSYQGGVVVETRRRSEPLSGGHERLRSVHHRSSHDLTPERGQGQHVDDRLGATRDAVRREELLDPRALQRALPPEGSDDGTDRALGELGRDPLLGEPAHRRCRRPPCGEGVQPPVVLRRHEVQRPPVQPADREGAVLRKTPVNVCFRDAGGAGAYREAARPQVLSLDGEQVRDDVRRLPRLPSGEELGVEPFESRCVHVFVAVVVHDAIERRGSRDVGSGAPAGDDGAVALDDAPRVLVHDRAGWREWLERHHGTSSAVWVVTPDRSAARERLEYDDLVEEALCFGWVDSTVRRVDDQHTMTYVARRRRGSTWAASNKERVARLGAAGLMRPAGLAAVDEAKADGSWAALDAVEALEVPPDLLNALAASPAARRAFDALSRSRKKELLWSVLSARRPDTRARRVAAAVDLLSPQLPVSDVARRAARANRPGVET